MELEFALVKVDAREIKDDRLPVSKELLQQLNIGAHNVLTGYNRL